MVGTGQVFAGAVVAVAAPFVTTAAAATGMFMGTATEGDGRGGGVAIPYP